MSNFLLLVSNDLINRYGNDLSDLTLVFPNQRARLFFNQHLSALIRKPIWAPTVTTINEIMQGLSKLQYDDSINLVTKLFNVYRKVKGIGEPFENFYFWGEVMLADFDQIDKYLIDAQKLFTNVKDIKEIEERFGGLTAEQSDALREYLGVIADSSQPSEIKSNFLSIWNILGDIYRDFNEVLQSQGLCYEGMAYRKAAEELLKDEIYKGNEKNIAFIGFNALNECEKILFKHYKREGKALFYWDYDPFFVDSKDHEAGLFIRDNISLFGNALPREVFENDPLQSKEVRLIAAPSTVTQSKLIPRILKEMVSHGAKLNESTAIVLPNESLLIPTLQAIPEDVEQLNITMGYPLKETPAYSLAEFLIRLQMNIRSSKSKEIRFYHRDVVCLLNHPYIRLCESEMASKLVSEIKLNNRIYPSATMMAKSHLLSRIFIEPKDGKPLTSYLIDVCNEVSQIFARKIEAEGNPHYRINLEFLYTLHKSLNRLHGVISSLNFEITYKVLLQLVRKAFHQERVSFSGEPLAGLQLMGFLETRALDFENIVILSFNDDILPGRSHSVSFITPSLRIAFGLPSHKFHDSLYAYYFYRLLHRAKQVYLVYSSRTEGLSSGEVSRFGLQLQMEQMYGKIKEISVGFDVNLTPPPTITIEKNEDVIELLLKNLEKKDRGITLSPSGLTSYITCPLRFYFRYCVGINEEEDIAEEIGALEFGQIIHKTMEMIYKSYSEKMVSGAMIESLLKDQKHVENVLDEVFFSIYLKENKVDKTENLSGRNMIARNAILYTIKKMLRVDMKRAPFFLKSQEEEIYVPIEVTINGQQKSILLGGYIDRLEKKDDTLWVIDYKTGRKDNSKGKFAVIEELFDPILVDKRKEVFQIFSYCHAVKHKYPEIKVKPAIWFVKTLKSEEELKVDFKVEKKYKPIEDYTPFMAEFKQRIEDLVTEIFNPSIPFSQTSRQDSCKSCPFISICGRE
jgi:RecB family exonuclease